MKITKARIKEIIREELQKLHENMRTSIEVSLVFTPRKTLDYKATSKNLYKQFRSRKIPLKWFIEATDTYQGYVFKNQKQINGLVNALMKEIGLISEGKLNEKKPWQGYKAHANHGKARVDFLNLISDFPDWKKYNKLTDKGKNIIFFMRKKSVPLVWQTSNGREVQATNLKGDESSYKSYNLKDVYKILIENVLDEAGPWSHDSYTDLMGSSYVSPKRDTSKGTGSKAFLQKFSSGEAKTIIDGQLKQWAGDLRKVQGRVVKDWMKAAKSGAIDYFDIVRGLKTGDIRRAHPYEVEFLVKLLNRDKIIDRFRSYFKGKKGKRNRRK